MRNSNININHKAIVRIYGIILLITGISMIFPWIYAFLISDTDTIAGFRIGCLSSILIGGAITVIFKSDKASFKLREAYIVVAMSWVIAILAGSMPYYFSDFTNSYIDALFESTSGFTTTGCSSTSLASMPNTLMLWKAISNWLGGMGIIVFAISLLPALGINGQFIARAEVPGPVLQKTSVRMSDSAKFLYITYFGFSLMEFILLSCSQKMPIFDAVINTLGSISTGGVTAHIDGIAHYDSIFVEVVISLFCLLSSLNYVLYHYAIQGKFSYLVKDMELRVYFAIIFFATAICTLFTYQIRGIGFGASLRESIFQVISYATTAGYVRTPSMMWPTTCLLIFIILMFIGGCSSSTAGSIKVVRVMIMFKLILRGCIRRIHPRSVVAVKLGKNTISAPLVSGITAFILTYIVLLLISMFILSFQGLPFENNLATSLAMLSNTGAGFGNAASLGNFSIFHPALRVYLGILMVMGRLELFTVIIFFSRSFWGKNH